MTKLSFVLIAIIFGWFIGCVYMIDTGISQIQKSSFRIGCMNSGAPKDAIEQCKDLADSKFK